MTGLPVRRRGSVAHRRQAVVGEVAAGAGGVAVGVGEQRLKGVHRAGPHDVERDVERRDIGGGGVVEHQRDRRVGAKGRARRKSRCAGLACRCRRPGTACRARRASARRNCASDARCISVAPSSVWAGLSSSRLLGSGVKP